jgi:ribosomal protein S10
MTQLLLKSYNKTLLQLYINYLKKTNNLLLNWKIVNFPKKVKKITLLRSPHVFKKSKDQYQEIIYTTALFFDFKQGIDVFDIVKNTPKSIFIKIKNIN